MAIIRLFVANLNYDTTEAELREFFSQAGRPTVIHIMNDRETKKPRGFGFVTLDTLGKEKNCWRTKLQGQELNGRALHIDFALPKEPRERV